MQEETSAVSPPEQRYNSLSKLEETKMSMEGELVFRN